MGPPGNIGSQAFQSAFKPPAVDAVGSSTSSTASSDGGVEAEDSSLDYETDWSSSWEPEHWDPLRPSLTPLTELTVLSCYTPPTLFDNCKPRSTIKEDAIRGSWRRVGKDLNKRIGLSYLYLFERELESSGGKVLIPRALDRAHLPFSLSQVASFPGVQHL